MYLFSYIYWPARSCSASSSDSFSPRVVRRWRSSALVIKPFPSYNRVIFRSDQFRSVQISSNQFWSGQVRWVSKCLNVNIIKDFVKVPNCKFKKVPCQLSKVSKSKKRKYLVKVSKYRYKKAPCQSVKVMGLEYIFFC